MPAEINFGVTVVTYKRSMGASGFDTLILSDLHLGSDISRANAALKVLKENSFRRLILLGDIFCDLNFRRLTKEHWRFLSYIRKLSNPKRNIEIVWVEGNHDQGLTEVMSHLVGIRVYQEYEWDFDGERHLAIHGHQFDGFSVNTIALGRLLTTFYLRMQKLDTRHKYIVRLLERLDTKWLRLTSKVSEGAIAYARERGVQRIFCGHTHEVIQMQKDGIEYFNTGCWTQPAATYITIDSEGVNTHEVRERTDDYYPSEERGQADWDSAEFASSAGLPADAEYEGVPG